MRFRIYAKGVKWTKDSIDKPYFYSKEKPDIRKNINDYMNNLIFSEWTNFKLNGSSLEIKTIVLDMFDYMDSNYCSILMNNKEYYYFIESIDILNEKGLVRLSLQLDTWTTYFEEMVNKLGNSVVALRKHGKRFKRNKDNQVVYNYDRTSNVWNIDSQFNNLAKHNARKQGCDTIIYLNEESNIILDKPIPSLSIEGLWEVLQMGFNNTATSWLNLQETFENINADPSKYKNIKFITSNGVKFPNNDPRGFNVAWDSKTINNKKVWFHRYTCGDTIVDCNHEIASDSPPIDNPNYRDSFTLTWSQKREAIGNTPIELYYVNPSSKEDNLYFKKGETSNFPKYNNQTTLPQKSWFINSIKESSFDNERNKYYVRPYQNDKTYPIFSNNNVVEMFTTKENLISDKKNYTNKIDPLFNFEEITGDINVKTDNIYFSIYSMILQGEEGLFHDMIIGECRGKKIGVYITCFLSLWDNPGTVGFVPKVILTLSTTPTHSGSIIERQSNLFQVYAPPEKGISYWSQAPDKIVYNIVPRTIVYNEAYRDIQPYEVIDITNDNYDYKREPQIWMSHCYENIFNYYNFKINKRFELNPNWEDIEIFKYITLTQMYVGVKLPTDTLNTIASNNTTNLDIEVPSNTDSYASYLALNKNSLQTSMYGIDKNIDFTKQAGNLSIKQAQVSAIMGGISSATSAIGGIVSGALGGVFSGTGGMIAGGIGGAISGLTNMGNTIAQGAMGVESAKLSAEKNNFGAEQQMRSAVASQLDIANAPDTINGVNYSFFDRGFYKYKIGSDSYRLWMLPTISTLEEYADYMNRYGYISGNQIHDFNKDRILIRKRFNYWQIQDIAIAINNRYKLPMFALKYYREIFNVGVRMWSDLEGMYDYSKENWEYEI